jgi:hypothetical protein
MFTTIYMVVANTAVLLTLLISSPALAKKEKPIAVEALTDRQVCKEIILHEANPPKYGKGSGIIGMIATPINRRKVDKLYERYTEIIIEERMRDLSCPRPNAVMILEED